MKETISKINAALDDKEEVDKKVKQKLNYAKKHCPENLHKYEEKKSC